MIVALLALAIEAQGPPGDRPDLMVAHPAIPCWVGSRGWTLPGEPPSRHLGFTTDGEQGPDRIEHNRDEFFDGADLVQLYNFIDYHFSNDDNRVLARTYLDDDPSAVEIRFRQDPPAEAEGAMRLIQPEILCYLQKRFTSIDVQTVSGSTRLWTRPRP